MASYLPSSCASYIFRVEIPDILNIPYLALRIRKNSALAFGLVESLKR
jgi:hypothetical protein